MNHMRNAPKNRNSRNKGGRNKSSGNIGNRVYESAGPEGKVRGTPQQVIDKYLQLARDAQTSGDRVVAENFLQHAEHYIRTLNAAMPPQTEDRRNQQAGQPGGESGSDNSSDDTAQAQSSAAQSSAAEPSDRGRPDSVKPQAETVTKEAPPSGTSGLETIDGGDDDGNNVVATPEATAQQGDGDSDDLGAPPPKPRRRTRRPKSVDSEEVVAE